MLSEKLTGVFVQVSLQVYEKSFLADVMRNPKDVPQVASGTAQRFEKIQVGKEFADLVEIVGIASE